MEEWFFGVIRSPRYRIRWEKSPNLPTVLEASPVGDSQSNGFVERAVRSVEDPQDRAGSKNWRETQHQSLRNWLDDRALRGSFKTNARLGKMDELFLSA